MQTATGALIRFLTGSSGGGGTGGSRQNTSVDVESGEQAEEAHQEEEKEVKNIIEIVRDAKNDLDKLVGDTSQSQKVRQYEEEFREVAGEIEEKVEEHQQHFESVHQHVVEAESEVQGLNEAQQELEGEMQESKKVFSNVKEKAREARRKLEELESEARQTGDMSEKDLKLVEGAIQDFSQVSRIAANAEKLEIGEEKEEMETLGEESNLEQRYLETQNSLRGVHREIKNGNDGEAKRKAKQTFKRMNSDQLDELEGELEYIIKEAKHVEELEEGSPQRVNNILKESKLIMGFLEEYAGE